VPIFAHPGAILREKNPKCSSGTSASALTSNGSIGVAIQMEALKTLCDEMGVDQVKQIAELFRK
jgi:hypothetical protein